MKNQGKSIKHWIVIAVCCGLTASSVGICINTAGVFYTPVSESLGVLRGTFALNSTLTMIGTAIAALFITQLIKKFNFKLVIGIGLFLTAGATLLMGLSNNILMFYVLGAVRGIGSALYGLIPATMIINQWFHKNHGLATSIVFSFSGIAGAIFSPVFSECISAFGWQTSYIIMSIVLVALCLPVMIYNFTIDPRKMGLLPYGMEKDISAEDTDVKTGSSFKFRQWTFIAMFIFTVFLTAITGIPQHFPGLSESVGYGSQVGAMMISAGMIGNILSKLAMGSMSDKFGAVKATVFMIFVNVISTVLILAHTSSTMLIIAAFLFGSVYGATAVGSTLLTKYFFGIENYDKVYPIITFAINMGGAFAITLVGYIYDFMGSYMYAFYIALVFQAINLILLFSILLFSAVVSNKKKRSKKSM